MKGLSKNIAPIKSGRLTLFIMLTVTFLLSFSVNAQEVTSETKMMREVAIQHMDNGRYGEAIDLLNKYIAATPRQAEGYNLRGKCYESRGQYQNAVLDFRRAIKLDKNFLEARTNLSRTQAVWYAQLKKKIKGHEREIAIDPDDPYNYLEIGKSYRWMEEWAEAEIWYDEYLLRDDNASPDEIIRFSEILAKLKKIKKGEIILKKWVDRYPEDWRLWSKYGYFTMWLGNYRNAENAFRTALGFKPFFKEAQDGLDQATRQAYVTQQNPRSFEKVYPIDRDYRILRRNPRDIDTRFRLVDLLIKAGRTEEAYQQLQILKVDDSEDPRFEDRWNYITIYREELYQSLIDEYKQKNRENKSDKTAASKLAEYYEFLGVYDSAQQVLEFYYYEVPDERDPKLKFQYANIAYHNADTALAFQLMDELVDDYPNNMDYKLYRAQIALWNNADLPMVEEYLKDVLQRRPNSMEALIAMGSVYLALQDFENAQVYVDRARVINRNYPDVVTLQSNIDFQKLRFEEQERYRILEEGRQHVVDGDCAKAIPYYEQYIAEVEPNVLLLKEYADVLYCSEQLDKALKQYDEILADDYNFDAAFQRANILYAKDDSTGAIAAYKELTEREPDKFEPHLNLADSYARWHQVDSANAIYDSLLTWNLDSTQISLIDQRQGWVPQTGLRGIVRSFPRSIAFAPSASFYNDNTSFKFSRFGGRLDIGINDFLTFGLSFYRASTAGVRGSLDSATVAKVDSISSYEYDFDRSFTSFKGHIFARISKFVRIGIGAGVLNAEGTQQDIEKEVSINFEPQDSLRIIGTYTNSDASILMYSPYLTDLTASGSRILSSIYSLEGKYIHENNWLFSGRIQYIVIDDKDLRSYDINNAGNDMKFRLGKVFSNDVTAGYEYYFSNYKFSELASPFYYAPNEFESHSFWADFGVTNSKTTKVSFGGKLGYVPGSEFILLEGTFDMYYKLLTNFEMRANLTLGSTSRSDASYRYFSGGFTAYWTF